MDKKRERVESLHRKHSAKGGNDDALTLSEIALESMDEVEQLRARLRQVAEIVNEPTTKASFVVEGVMLKGALPDMLFGVPGVEVGVLPMVLQEPKADGPEITDVGLVSHQKVHDGDKVLSVTRRNAPCLLALRLLNPDEPCRDPECGYPAKEHRNYHGTSK